MSRAQDIAQVLATRAPEIARHLLPRGRAIGIEYKVGSVAGEPGDSLSIHIGRGAKSGIWQDFATGENGDLLDLWAAVRCAGDLNAAMRQAGDYLGIRSDAARRGPLRQTATPADLEQWQTIPDYTEGPDWSALCGPSLSGYRLTGQWTYHDEGGNPVLLHWRFDKLGARKQFRPFRWVGDGWKCNWPGRRPLFNLPAVLSDNRPVLIVEGEKAAEAAAELLPEYSVTTWPAGAKSVGKVEWSPLAGREIVIWPDADEPGRAAAGEIASHLGRVASSVAIVALPDELPDGWDLADTLPEGWTRDTLWQLIRQAAPLAVAKDALEETPRLDLAGDIDTPPPSLAWHVHGLLPAGHVALLVGEGGSGKSLLAMQMAAATATGGRFLGKNVKAGRSLAIYCEDDPDTLRRRQHDINRQYELTVEDLRDIYAYPRLGQDNFLICFDGIRGAATAFHSELERLIVEVQPSLLLLDNLAHLFAGNENDRVQVQQFLNRLTRLAQQHSLTVVLLSHPSKSHNVSGSTGWEAHVRSVLSLEFPKAEEIHQTKRNDERILRLVKSNYVKRGTEIALLYDNGVFLPVEDDQTPGFAGYLDEESKRRRAGEVFLDALDFLEGVGIHVSSSSKSEHYAPRAMADKAPMVKAAKLSTDELKRAMADLFSRRAIVEVPLGSPSSGRRKITRARPSPS